MKQRTDDPEAIGAVIEKSLASAQARLDQRREVLETEQRRTRPRRQRPAEPPVVVDTTRKVKPLPAPDLTETSYHDFDLAEFPWCLLSLRDRPADLTAPLVYRDSITGRHGDQVERIFETFPAPPQEGRSEPVFPGPTAYALFYCLLQLYIEQGASDDKIVFGSLRALCKRLGIEISGANVRRIARDLDVLSGIRLRATNAYWDEAKHAYAHMRMWSPLTGAFYFTSKPGFSFQEELPFGYVNIHPQLQAIAKTRGFFALGFSSKLFYKLKPLEQRLAVYLSRRFQFQGYVRRHFDGLADTLPIRAARPDHRRAMLRRAVKGLVEKGYPCLGPEDFRLRKHRGVWLAEFRRRQKPQPERPVGRFQAEVELTPHQRERVNALVAITDDPEAFFWYAHCTKELGPDVIGRALGNFRELYIEGGQPIRETKGKAMTGILKGLAKELGISLGKH